LSLFDDYPTVVTVTWLLALAYSLFGLILGSFLNVCIYHWCSQQRSHPAAPLEKYLREDLEREFHTTESCAPYCAVSCVHRVALVDNPRERPVETLTELALGRERGIRAPWTVNLRWMFVTAGSVNCLERRRRACWA
jgi:prepilin signal peptidase PulO-like enzyme (type II secretory pathway)